jgi:hypothetical protein
MIESLHGNWRQANFQFVVPNFAKIRGRASCLKEWNLLNRTIRPIRLLATIEATVKPFSKPPFFFHPGFKSKIRLICLWLFLQLVASRLYDIAEAPRPSPVLWRSERIIGGSQPITCLNAYENVVALKVCLTGHGEMFCTHVRLPLSARTTFNHF